MIMYMILNDDLHTYYYSMGKNWKTTSVTPRSRAGAAFFFSEALGDFNLKATAGLPPEKQKAECLADFFF